MNLDDIRTRIFKIFLTKIDSVQDEDHRRAAHAFADLVTSSQSTMGEVPLQRPLGGLTCPLHGSEEEGRTSSPTASVSEMLPIAQVCRSCTHVSNTHE